MARARMALAMAVMFLVELDMLWVGGSRETGILAWVTRLLCFTTTSLIKEQHQGPCQANEHHPSSRAIVDRTLNVTQAEHRKRPSSRSLSAPNCSLNNIAERQPSRQRCLAPGNQAISLLTKRHPQMDYAPVYTPQKVATPTNAKVGGRRCLISDIRLLAVHLNYRLYSAH